MQITEVVPVEINHHPGDVIPVFDDQRNIVGRVVRALAVYILDGREHTQVTVEITDEAVKRAIILHSESLRPVLHIYFPHGIFEL